MLCDCTFEAGKGKLCLAFFFFFVLPVQVCGVVCGQAVNTSNSRSGGPGFKPRPSRCLDKELYSTLSLFTQVYQWVPAMYCWGVTMRWSSVPSRGE